MSRELRRRTSRPDYAAMFRYEDEDGAGPSNAAPTFDEEMDSGSDFTPEAAELQEEELDDAGDEEEELSEEEPVDQDASDREELPISTQVPKASKKVGRKNVVLASGPSTTRLVASNSTPSLHHRHRAIPIHQRTSQVERLKSAPKLYIQPDVVPTNGWSANDKVVLRVNKTWGANVGPGPVWEVLEDRAWFKETTDTKHESEATRRPKVHQNIQSAAIHQILSRDAALPFLPATTLSTTPENSSVKCFFGPFGKQKEVETRLFDALKMETFFPGSKSHVFNVGAPVWGLDWCPIHPDDRPATAFKQYLAVGPFPSRQYSPEIGVKRRRASCIQIWSLGPSPPGIVPEESEDPGMAKCEMVICVDSGPAHELKWCPLPSHSPLQGTSSTPRTLGLLAGTFEDGSLSIYSVPFPPDLLPEGKTGPEPIYVKLSPLLRFELEDTCCWSLDWGNSEVIAAGCTNGAIAVYNVKNALELIRSNPSTPILPDQFFFTHQCAIRSLTWIRAPTFSANAELSHADPTVIVGGGYDGLLSATDIREPYGNEIYRTRDVINSVCYSTYSGGPISLDQGQVKVVSLAPIMLNKGHTLLDPDGPVWSVHASDYHPQLAVGVTDGSCITTNTLRATRRGGSVPFLMHKIYQLDYSQKTGQFRMLEHILPKETDRASGRKAAKSASKSSGAWPPEIGVQRVVWNSGNGLGNASLLASATGCGLCRIDWLTGKWHKDNMPYKTIEVIRAEGEHEADDIEDDMEDGIDDDGEGEIDDGMEDDSN